MMHELWLGFLKSWWLIVPPFVLLIIYGILEDIWTSQKR